MHGVGERGGGVALRGLQRRRRIVGVEAARDRLRRSRDGFERASVHECVDDAARAGCGVGQRLFGKGDAPRRRLEHARAGGRDALGGRTRQAVKGADRFRRGLLGGARRKAQGHAARRQRVARDPVDEVP